MPIEFEQNLDKELFGELQQHLQDLSESFQVHCCWKAGFKLQVENRLNEYAAKHSCQYCAAYKARGEHEKACIEHDRYTLTALMAEHQDWFEARCPAGAVELVIPFHQNGICLGAVLCGPYRKVEDPVNDLLTVLTASRKKSLVNIIRTMLKNTVGSAYSGKIPESTDQRLKNAVKFIRKNFRRRITAEEAAVQANLSRSRFLHLFPQEFGKTFGAYLIDLRIAESCKLLRKKSLTIDEIALSLGFCSQSHFTSTFQKIMHTTPKAYRSRCVESAEQ